MLVSVGVRLLGRLAASFVLGSALLLWASPAAVSAPRRRSHHRAPARCAVPRGDKRLASDARALVYAEPTTPGSGSAETSAVAWKACLRPRGKPWRLATGYTDDEGGRGLAATALNGDEAALDIVSYDGKYQTCQQTIERFDLSTRTKTPLSGPGCVSFADRSVRSLSVNAAGLVAWISPIFVSRIGDVTGVACSATPLCAVTGLGGNVFISHDPTAPVPTWIAETIGGLQNLGGISCAGTALCLATASAPSAIGGAPPQNLLLTTTDPGDPQPRWTVTQVAGSGAVSCPQASFCAVLGRGEVFTSVNPTGDVFAWHATAVGLPRTELMGLSCPAASFCAAIDDHGDIYTSSDPADFSAPWSASAVDPGPFTLGGVLPIGGTPASISCPTPELCVAVDSLGNVLSSHDPTGGPSAWQLAHVDAALIPGGGETISCPSSTFCALSDPAHELVSTDPPGGAASWHTVLTYPTPFGGFEACASTAFCLSFDGTQSYTSVTPQTAGSWTTGALPPLCTTGTTCESDALYAAGQPGTPGGTQLLDSVGPSSGPEITDLKISGDVVSWRSGGAARSAVLP